MADRHRNSTFSPISSLLTPGLALVVSLTVNKCIWFNELDNYSSSKLEPEMPITPHAYGKTSSKLELLTFTFLTILLKLKMTLLFMEELCDRNCVVLSTDKGCMHAHMLN